MTDGDKAIYVPHSIVHDRDRSIDALALSRFSPNAIRHTPIVGRP